MSNQERIEALKEDLRQHRDELRLKLHLAGEEGKEQWEALEKKYENFAARASQMRREAGDISSDLVTATGLLGEEIKKGYKRLRDLL